jgi:acetoin utilization protein AcuB
MRGAERMTPNPSVGRLGESLAATWAIMRAEGLRHLPVVERKRVLGVITDRDLRQHAERLNETLVETVMTTDRATISPHATVEETASLMLVRRIGCLPLIENGGLVGDHHHRLVKGPA